jgi:hypothetical protein
MQQISNRDAKLWQFLQHYHPGECTFNNIFCVLIKWEVVSQEKSKQSAFTYFFQFVVVQKQPRGKLVFLCKIKKWRLKLYEDIPHIIRFITSNRVKSSINLLLLIVIHEKVWVKPYVNWLNTAKWTSTRIVHICIV